MSKSILVVDTPSSCVTCPISFYNDVYREHQCGGGEYYRTIQDYKEQGKYVGLDDKRPGWCPLLPLPERKDISHLTGSTLDQVVERQYNQGFNDCLDKIKGETKC